MAIIEAVLFNNELELLEARFHEGDGVVDRWVIIESTKTFTGAPKLLHFETALSVGRFWQIEDRIDHLVIDHTRETDDPWEREADQRNALASILWKFQDDDLIALSDGDELTRRSAWSEILERTANGESVSLHKPTWYYTLTWALLDSEWGSNASFRSKAARVSTLRSYKQISDWADERYFPTVEDSGWHLSCLGGPARLLAKLTSFSHQEIAPDGGFTYEDCKRFIQEGIDCARGRNATLKVTEPSGPQWLIEDGVKKYPWLLTGEDPCTLPS